jgi:hypothetical protein
VVAQFVCFFVLVIVVVLVLDLVVYS